MSEDNTETQFAQMFPIIYVSIFSKLFKNSWFLLSNNSWLLWDKQKTLQKLASILVSEQDF